MTKRFVSHWYFCITLIFWNRSAVRQFDHQAGIAARNAKVGQSPHAIGWLRFAIGTPLWKSNRNFFSTQFFYHLFFVVCFSFYTWYMWGGQYQLCKFLLDFDHWLCLSDILKKVTGSKPDVALVWFRQWAKLELEHGEKDRYWCIVRVYVQGRAIIKHLKIWFDGSREMCIRITLHDVA